MEEDGGAAGSGRALEEPRGGGEEKDDPREAKLAPQSLAVHVLLDASGCHSARGTALPIGV